MKTISRIALIGGVFAAICIIGFLGLRYCYVYHLLPDRMDSDQSRAKQISLLLQTWALDSKTTGDRGIFPSSLSDIPKAGYVSEADFDKLTNGVTLDYRPPTSGRPSDTNIILIVHGSKGTQQIAASGDIIFKKK